MKNQIYFLLILSVFFFACKKDDNVEIEEPKTEVTEPKDEEDTFKPFIFTMRVTEDDLSVNIPTNSDYEYAYQVDWGDSTTSQENGKAQHSYQTTGDYQIKITGTFPAIYFFEDSEFYNTQLISVQQWGDFIWESMEVAFYHCENLKELPLESPNLSLVTNMERMFSSAKIFNQDISIWNVSNVNKMGGMFWDAKNFNQDISSWDVSNVTDMSWMFLNAQNFNQDISNWDVSNVKDMNSMFEDAYSFNQDISSWDVSNVTDMSWMFLNAQNFNQDISNWNVSNVTNMGSMFEDAYNFNQNISSWNVSNVTDMSWMFWGARNFNQDISGWNVTKVQDYEDFSTDSALTPENLPKFGN